MKKNGCLYPKRWADTFKRLKMRERKTVESLRPSNPFKTLCHYVNVICVCKNTPDLFCMSVEF
jgi:hypothetical protein